MQITYKYKNMLNIIDHQVNANQNHSEVLFYIRYNAYY